MSKRKQPPRKKARKNTEKNEVEMKSKSDDNSQDEFLLLLAKTKVDDILTTKIPIITATREDNLSHLLALMIKNSILSVPILLKDQEYYGFLDVLDIITWIVDKEGEKSLMEIEGIEGIAALLKDTKVKNIMRSPYGKRNPYRYVETETSLLSAMEILAKGIHRIAVVDKVTKEIVNIITQSSVVHWIKQHQSSLGDRLSTKVSELGDCYAYVASVYATSSAIEAFRLISIGRFHGIAVLDEDDKIVGNISARDIKKIASDGKFF